MTVAITGSVVPVRHALAAALEARGHRTIELDSAGDLAASLGTDARASDPVTVLIRIGFDHVHTQRLALAAMTSAEWGDRVERPLRAALAFHQVASRHLTEGGRVIVVVPTTGLTGAAQAVALGTAAEAERSLVKSQSRALGARGITVNCVAAGSGLLAGKPIDRAGLQATSLPAPTFDDVAAAIDALIDPRLGAVTGQTVAVDAGRWTAP